MPESVLTQTMPLGLAGGVCCCTAGLAGAGALEEVLDWAGVGVGVGAGLLTAGGVEAVLVGAGLDGAEFAAGATGAELSTEADFLERAFLGGAASVPAATEADAQKAGYRASEKQ